MEEKHHTETDIFQIIDKHLKQHRQNTQAKRSADPFLETFIITGMIMSCVTIIGFFFLSLSRGAFIPVNIVVSIVQFSFILINIPFLFKVVISFFKLEKVNGVKPSLVSALITKDREFNQIPLKGLSKVTKQVRERFLELTEQTEKKVRTQTSEVWKMTGFFFALETFSFSYFNYHLNLMEVFNMYPALKALTGVSITFAVTMSTRNFIFVIPRLHLYNSFVRYSLK